MDKAPILFESGDHLDIKYSIQRIGQLGFNNYMRYLHEAYKDQKLNIHSEYCGSWSLTL